MKTITVTEPWASLICCGAKMIETRSWPTSYRGPIAIHAAKTLPGYAADFIRYDEQLRRAFTEHRLNPVSGEPDPNESYFKFTGPHAEYDWQCVQAWPIKRFMQLTRGCVIATADLIGCYRTEFLTSECNLSADELAFGDFTPGRSGFRLANVKRLPEPIPAVGQLGIWDWMPPAGLLERIAA